MPSPTTNADRTRIAREVLGQDGDFTSFVDLYDKSVVKHDRRECNPNDAAEPARYHDAILHIIQYLKANVNGTRDQALVKLQNEQTLCNVEIDHALDVAVQIMIMVDSAIQNWQPSSYTIGGYKTLSWDPTDSFLNFVERTFEKDSASDSNAGRIALEDRHVLKAWKLKRRLGIQIRPTDNLADHLSFNKQDNILFLFHHAAFLKAHLKKDLNWDSNFEHSLKSGTLPPRLLLETLHSLQDILFPYTHDKSAKVLEQLIKTNQFDNECKLYDGYIPFKDLPRDFTYIYWGKRLAKLHALTFMKRPKNRMERVFWNHATELNALLLALLALLISIVIGILSIFLGIFQSWVSWQAWKNPVSNSPPVASMR